MLSNGIDLIASLVSSHSGVTMIFGKIPDLSFAGRERTPYDVDEIVCRDCEQVFYDWWDADNPGNNMTVH